MKLLLFIAWLGNLIDTAATLYLAGLGYHEANPIMRPLLQYPLAFVVVKLCTMAAVLQWLWNERNNKLAMITSWFAAILYGGIATYYVAWLI